MSEHTEPTRQPWMTEGACLGCDPNLFFPRRGQDAAPAKAVCATCPVKQLCLDYALAQTERHGVWGGKSERERRALRRQQHKAAA